MQGSGDWEHLVYRDLQAGGPQLELSTRWSNGPTSGSVGGGEAQGHGHPGSRRHYHSERGSEVLARRQQCKDASPVQGRIPTTRLFFRLRRCFYSIGLGLRGRQAQDPTESKSLGSSSYTERPTNKPRGGSRPSLRSVGEGMKQPRCAGGSRCRQKRWWHGRPTAPALAGPAAPASACSNIPDGITGPGTLLQYKGEGAITQ